MHTPCNNSYAFSPHIIVTSLRYPDWEDNQIRNNSAGARELCDYYMERGIVGFKNGENICSEEEEAMEEMQSVKIQYLDDAIERLHYWQHKSSHLPTGFQYSRFRRDLCHPTALPHQIQSLAGFPQYGIGRYGHSYGLPCRAARMLACTTSRGCSIPETLVLQRGI